MAAFAELAKECEHKELEAESGVVDVEVYSRLLAIYLVRNDLVNAKFLWKRIPEEIRERSEELCAIWEIGKGMWQRQYPQVYASFNYSWSGPIKPIINELEASYRNRAFQLVSRAYDSIGWKDFAAIVGLSVENAIQAARDMKWTVDDNAQMIMPLKIVDDRQAKAITNEQLKKLTDYVTYLEN